MKPAPFSYHAAQTLDEAFALLQAHGDEARILAGGQSLTPMMNMRMARPTHLVDIGGIEDLAYIRGNGDRIEIGALTRHYQLEQSSLVQRVCPILAAAARNIGHYAIRQRGTIGGSLAHADPAAELPLMAVLFDTEIEIGSGAGNRVVMASDFLVSIYTTALKPNEILTQVVFPTLVAGEGWGFRWVSRRVGDFAIVSVAVTVKLDSSGRVERLRLAVGGVDAKPLALGQLADAYVGQGPGSRWVEAIAEEAAGQMQPGSDLHASAEYRRELTQVLLRRALRDALDRLGKH